MTPRIASILLLLVACQRESAPPPRATGYAVGDLRGVAWVELRAN